MSQKTRKTTILEKTKKAEKAEKAEKTEKIKKMENLAAEPSQVPSEKGDQAPVTPDASSVSNSEHERLLDKIGAELKEQMENNHRYREQIKEGHSQLFDHWESKEITSNDYKIDVPIDSLESKVGFNSLIRQLHQSFSRTIAFHQSKEGGALTGDEARIETFHRAENTEEAKKIFSRVMSYPYENISFDDLHALSGYAPRAAEHLWEEIKKEGRAEFESGHHAANTMFPIGYMKQA